MKDSDSAEAPVPVRDLLKPVTSTAAPAADGEAEPAAATTEHTFEMDGVDWIARPAGMGCYGTGRSGMALIQAIHFYQADVPERPVREALLPAWRFQHLAPTDLRAIFTGATPIELSD